MKILTNLTKINGPLANLEFTLRKRNFQGKNVPEYTIWRPLAGHILLGYQKITDQIVYLDYKISKSSVKNILIENGYDPEPDLTVRSTWHEFIQSHWDVLAACDFFTIELLVSRKLVPKQVSSLRLPRSGADDFTGT